MTLEEQITELTGAVGSVQGDLKKVLANGGGKRSWETFWKVLSIVVMPIILLVAIWMGSLDNRVVRIEEALSSPHIIELLSDHETRIRSLERSS